MVRVWILDDAMYPVPFYSARRRAKGTMPPYEVPEDVLKEYDDAAATFRAACDKLDSYRDEEEA